jgi:glycogen debranching enzyme
MLVPDCGQPWPSGASCAVQRGIPGLNFAVHSRYAERIEVCLYDALGLAETERFALPAFSNGIWHGFVAGLGVGQLYGLRAFGPYQPIRGHRFNPAKLLMDPFARALYGGTQRLSLEFGFQTVAPTTSLAQPESRDDSDNAARIPKAQVLDITAELLAGAAITPGPRVAPAQTVLYEAHVKGLTQAHPDVPLLLRGRYAGLVSAPMLAHYARLGITTLCLLPVHLHIAEAHLLRRGLPNYWGYNTLNYFMPEPGYASGQYPNDRAEFRHMVDQLHRQGLEVVLDVVYNHTAEADALGPTLSWRGLDNASWYALDAAGDYLNFSGCGNSLNLAQPCAIQLVMDSLRWWVQAFGVDGFRFDLATSLGRDPALQHHFSPLAGLLSAIAQDPVLAGVKLIAEPWDLGPDGYKLGQFPNRWHEWNDRFRDTSRAFWLGFDSTRGDLAKRLTGSSDYFDHDARGPLSSINLITAHDGMTLADLTSYRYKHNLANGEDNRDGHPQNFSANAGVEGETSDADVLTHRRQWRQALVATLLCSQGTPQLLAGDEIGHTQHGNNNAYCQDNEISWLNWSEADQALADFVAGLVHLRQAHEALRHVRWFRGSRASQSDGVDIVWRNPDGSPLSINDWEDQHSRSLACVIEVSAPGQVPGWRWFFALHAADQAAAFGLPDGLWRQVLDSAAGLVLQAPSWGQASTWVGEFTASARTVVALVQPVECPLLSFHLEGSP